MDTVKGHSSLNGWRIGWIILTLMSLGGGIVLFFMSGSLTKINSILSTVVTLFIFIFQAVLSWQDIWKNKSEHETLILNLGIFGTFLGIVIGLATFDISQLKANDANSIVETLSPLLNGMKTAFITSAIGLAYTCLIILRDTVAPSQSQSDTETIEELQEKYMEEALIFFKEQSSQGEVFQKILKALTGDSPESLSVKIGGIGDILNETKNSLLKEGFEPLKAETRGAIDAVLVKLDGHQEIFTKIKEDNTSAKDEIVAELVKLQKEFVNFAQEAAKSNIEALMEALKETMKDFNNNLTEQFGDNFKKLNESVDKLLTWQNSYREHIEETEKHLKTVLERFDSAQAALEEVSQNAQILLEAGDSMAGASQKLQNEHSAILDQLETLSLLKDNIADLPTELKEVVKGFSTIPEEAIGLHSDMLEKMKDIYKKTTNALETHHYDLVQKSEESIRQIKDAFSKSSTHLDETTAKLRGNFSDEVQNNITNTINFVGQVEEALRGQLQGILQEFGNNLTTITDAMIKLHETNKIPKQGR